MAQHMQRLLLTWFCFACLLAAPRASHAQPSETHRIHLRAKPAVVRITAGHLASVTWPNGAVQKVSDTVSSGSGFIIHPSGYVLTNAHVVDSVKQGDEAARQRFWVRFLSEELKRRGFTATQANLSQINSDYSTAGVRLTVERVNRVYLQSGKALPFEIKSFGAPLMQGQDLESGKDVAVLKVEARNAPTLPLGGSADVQVGERVWLMGYPGAADSIALDAESRLEPTTTDGTISARKTTRDGTPVLQTNASATHGNSGGPLLNAAGEVIGLLTFGGNRVNNQEVQGFSFVVPVDTANEFVRQAGVDNQPSSVDQKWQSGLEHYWNQEYALAQEDFREIVTLLFELHYTNTCVLRVYPTIRHTNEFWAVLKRRS